MNQDALDKLDRSILRMLQQDGRATFDQIAESVGLSPSAVLRRVRPALAAEALSYAGLDMDLVAHRVRRGRLGHGRRPAVGDHDRIAHRRARQPGA